MNRELGLWGEELAAQYLGKKGYKILERNFYTRYGELDLVCEKDDNIVFVEVKTRRSTRFGSPEEAITPRKMGNMKKAAILYLKSSPRFFPEISFDVVSILVEDGKSRINHIINAF
ncbi:YraN family protein [Syntrophomonas wolfei]|jgi:putative endonuclease|nr:YraN family protein [Syntrophomonas wolfei]